MLKEGILLAPFDIPVPLELHDFFQVIYYFKRREEAEVKTSIVR